MAFQAITNIKLMGKTYEGITSWPSWQLTNRSRRRAHLSWIWVQLWSYEACWLLAWLGLMIRAFDDNRKKKAEERKKKNAQAEIQCFNSSSLSSEDSSSEVAQLPAFLLVKWHFELSSVYCLILMRLWTTIPVFSVSRYYYLIDSYWFLFSYH